MHASVSAEVELVYLCAEAIKQDAESCRKPERSLWLPYTVESLEQAGLGVHTTTTSQDFQFDRSATRIEDDRRERVVLPALLPSVQRSLPCKSKRNCISQGPVLFTNCNDDICSLRRQRFSASTTERSQRKVKRADHEETEGWSSSHHRAVSQSVKGLPDLPPLQISSALVTQLFFSSLVLPRLLSSAKSQTDCLA